MRKKIALIVLFAAMYVVLGVRGEAIEFRHLTQEHGLSQNSANYILQDSKGFMWFGTDDGLNRFDGYDFKVYRPEPGNPFSIAANGIAALCEDKSGEIWVGFHGKGLDRYSPETDRFYHYRYRRGDPAGLSSDIVNDILADRSGMLWIGTSIGLDRLDPATGRFEHIRSAADDPRGLGDEPVTAIHEDRAGILWVSALNGLVRYDPKDGSFTRYTADPDDPGSLISNRVRTICEDRQGGFWVGTYKGLQLMDRESGRFRRFLSRPGDPVSISNDYILSIFEDSGGTLWIGTANGLNRRDPGSGRFTRYLPAPGVPGALSTSVVMRIYEDRGGVLWISTNGGGIHIYNREQSRFTTYRVSPGSPYSLSSNVIGSVLVSKNGIIWLGTSGGGLNRVDRNDMASPVKVYRHRPNDPSSLGSDFVSGLAEDRRGVLWVGTSDKGLYRFHRESGSFTGYRANPGNPAGLLEDAVLMLYPGGGDSLWISTGSGLCRMDTVTGVFRTFRPEKGNPNSLSDWRIGGFYRDRSGNLWISTGRGGLNRYDPDNESFRHYKHRPGDPTSISSGELMGILEDRDGKIWVGSNGDGLNCLDPANGIVSHYRESDGLANNVVYDILEDDDGFLWISTNNGISKFKPGSVKNYDRRDGLQGNEFSQSTCFKGDDGEMFFGGVNGVTAFHPSRIKDNPYVPPVVLTGFLIFNKPVPIGLDAALARYIGCADKIVLSHEQTVFSFEFAALSYAIPEKNRYAYKMDGFDEEWTYTGHKKRFATYTNLDPGSYVFHVKASNHDGAWNEAGVSVWVIIKPPFWKTWWFLTGSGMLILLLLFYGYRIRTRDLSQRMRLQTELQTARTAQMSIMPQSDPEVPGFDISGTCVPANEVGGDFFDYIWLDRANTKFAIAVADVSGKAMQAAMTAVMSSGMLFSRAYESGAVREIMTRINRSLYYKTDKKMFTALLLAALDTRTGVLTFTNAGLNYPVLKIGNSVISLAGIGSKIPLGMVKDNSYREKSRRLQEGDLVVMFSDGIIDSRDPGGDFYGLPRLIGFLETLDTGPLSAAEIKDRIISHVNAFSGSRPQQDDMTVVVVKRRKSDSIKDQ